MPPVRSADAVEAVADEEADTAAALCLSTSPGDMIPDSVSTPVGHQGVRHAAG